MSVITKAGSDNASCVTGQGGGTPPPPEPKATLTLSTSSRADLNYSSFQNPSRIYQQPPSSKVVRILTVLAYIVAVSMAAILLSIYYTFIWNPYELKSPHGVLTNSSFISEQTIRDQSQYKSDNNQFMPLPYSINVTTKSGSNSPQQPDSSAQPHSFQPDETTLNWTAPKPATRKHSGDHVARLVLSNNAVVIATDSAEEQENDQMATSEKSALSNSTERTQLSTAEPNFTSATEVHG